MRTTKITAGTAALVVVAVALAGCGGDSRKATAAPAASTSAAPPVSAADSTMTFGAGCAAMPAGAGPGSFAAMSRQPVATAAAGNPQLSTLAGALERAGLADKLNTAPALTVFAPVNDAFGKIPAADFQTVLADQETLARILSYHVVEGALTPAQLAGSHRTLQGDELTIAGGGTDLTINEASVVCGNVRTANATVYLIDSVLMPQS